MAGTPAKDLSLIGWRSRLQVLWRGLPTGARRRFWVALAAARRAALPVRTALAWRRGQAASRAEDGIVVAGLLSDTRGVARAARLFADGAQAQGLLVARVDVGATLGLAPALEPATLPDAGALPRQGALISCLNPPELLRWLERDGLRVLRGRRHIGYWAWELPQAPPAWAKALAYVDEVWCHSEFAAGAFRRLAAGRAPVRVVRPPLFVSPSTASDRARFGLPQEGCVVLAVMDLRSSAERKNPLGALGAYLAAQPVPSASATLVCKLSGLHSDAAAAAILTAAAKSRPDVRLITEALSETDMASLLASADVVLSLHRAEGFGLLAAEAAWAGIPVVTTAWSAPLEFLQPQGAALIGWVASPVTDSQNLYTGKGLADVTWAEPNAAEAAERLHELMVSAELRQRMGARAAIHAREVFEPARWIESVRHHLDGGPAG